MQILQEAYFSQGKQVREDECSMSDKSTKKKDDKKLAKDTGKNTSKKASAKE